MIRRTQAVSVCFLTVLAVTAGMVWAANDKVQSVAGQAQQDLLEGQKLIRTINLAKQSPLQFADRSMTQIEAARLIDAACQEATLSPESIVRIWPEAARPLGDSGYQTAETQILIRRAPLPELIVFLNQLTLDQPGLRVEAIRLSEDRSQTSFSLSQSPSGNSAAPAVNYHHAHSSPELWNAEVTLLQTFLADTSGAGETGL